MQDASHACFLRWHLCRTNLSRKVLKSKNKTTEPKKTWNGNVQTIVCTSASEYCEGTTHENMGFRDKRAKKWHRNLKNNPKRPKRLKALFCHLIIVHWPFLKLVHRQIQSQIRTFFHRCASAGIAMQIASCNITGTKKERTKWWLRIQACKQRVAHSEPHMTVKTGAVETSVMRGLKTAHNELEANTYCVGSHDQNRDRVL